MGIAAVVAPRASVQALVSTESLRCGQLSNGEHRAHGPRAVMWGRGEGRATLSSRRYSAYRGVCISVLA